MMMNGHEFQSLKGQFLLAMPSMQDPNFSRAVVYLCEHSAEGAMGFVINRSSLTLGPIDIFNEFALAHGDTALAVQVYTGGPVQLDEIFLLHGHPFDAEGSYLIDDGVALSNSMETLAAVARGEGPEKVAIFLGTAGWAAGQLEKELMENTWLTLEAGSDLIFDVPVEARWENGLARLGIDPLLLSGDFGNA